MSEKIGQVVVMIYSQDLKLRRYVSKAKTSVT